MISGMDEKRFDEQRLEGGTMSVLTAKTANFLESSSWIRKMFEAGLELKQEHGEDRVYDFSLGNPDLIPPKEVGVGLRAIAERTGTPLSLGYMPNAGYPHVRERLAQKVSQEQGVGVDRDDLLLTSGAAGGLNSFFKAVLEPGEEVLCPAPFFVEYRFYADNFGAGLKPVPAKADDFHLDLQAMEAAFSEKTRVVLINSPNNPTGQVYDLEELQLLADLLQRKTREQGRPVFLVSDEPYRFLTYDGVTIPSILPLYEQSLVISSFSKNLALAGERIGYVLLNPAMSEKKSLMDGLVFTNRILGFVNAPTVGQQLLEFALDAGVDVSIYEQRRQLLGRILKESGYEFLWPRGGFYFFPKAPGGDDLAFVKRLQQERILAVPGSGFGFPGHFRLSFSVPDKVINDSGPSFARAMSRNEGRQLHPK